MKPVKVKSQEIESALVEKLVAFLEEDSTDRTAAEYLLELLRSGRAEPTIAMRAYRSAIRQVYFSDAAKAKENESCRRSDTRAFVKFD